MRSAEFDVEPAALALDRIYHVHERLFCGSFGLLSFEVALALGRNLFDQIYGDELHRQRRAARGFGGHALLWLKTLRDLVVSLPAVYANERSRALSSSGSKGAVLVWTVVVLLGFTFLLSSVVLPSWISRMPSADDVAQVPDPGLAGNLDGRVQHDVRHPVELVGPA